MAQRTSGPGGPRRRPDQAPGRRGEQGPKRGGPAGHKGPRDAGGLRSALRDMHGASYGRYKSLSGQWRFDGFTLEIQKVQPDPYAPASRCEVRVDAETAELPKELMPIHEGKEEQGDEENKTVTQKNKFLKNFDFNIIARIV
ncbi:MAG: hypothetical protein IJH84_28265, partial [Saccharopolyspora sp.]|uniref:ABC-ATPase domain-containing protein n=1 Tax=Saccharopolyspora sp. TaxID=33915 RepID=UPI0025CEE400